ncbi:heat shock protein 9/12-domain-containing protein [Kockiozyma suomiensis]|uniref:heat shock protein 9/12-domain-containing protein n=1 Tax=Kockiozyma suomiensis TaxID=1337062 RepID=UPI003343D12A
MSDAGRKPVSDKISETITPDSQKSYAEQIKESATGAYDKVARDIQPEESKSTFQSGVDSVTGGSSDAKKSADENSASFVDTAKEYAASAQQSAADALNSASEYLSGSAKK